jgi:hypothetical protein
MPVHPRHRFSYNCNLNFINFFFQYSITLLKTGLSISVSITSFLVQNYRILGESFDQKKTKCNYPSPCSGFPCIWFLLWLTLGTMHNFFLGVLSLLSVHGILCCALVMSKYTACIFSLQLAKNIANLIDSLVRLVSEETKQMFFT